MDKRLLLALALTALVILVFQVVFPPAKRPAGLSPADSVAAAATTGGAAGASTTPPLTPGGASGTPTLAAGAGANGAGANGVAGAGSTGATNGRGSSATAGNGIGGNGTGPNRAGGNGPGANGAGATSAAVAAMPAVPPETTDVRTKHAVFQMTNVGATPLGVAMLDYKNLRANPATPLVNLGVPDAPMFRYRVLAPPDTFDLATVTFHSTRTTAPNGAPVLTYQATLRDSAQVTIAYTFDPDGYLAHVTGTVHGVTGGYLLASLPDGFHSAEADTADDQRAFAYVAKRAHADPEGTLFDKLKPGETQTVPSPVEWVALKSKYFVVGLLAPSDTTVAAHFEEVALLGGARIGAAKTATTAAATAVQPLRNGTFAFDLYAGPQEWRRLHAIDRDFEDVNPYGGFFHGLVQPFATIIVRVLIWMRAHLTLGYGWIIIIFGIAIRLLLWPLNQKAMRSNIKMQALQPELQAVQTRYKNDPQKLQEAMMKVYKDHGMSPLSPIMGCLPMLIPMPILLTLLFVLRNTIEFRGVSFLWLHDISLQDPYYILPLLMGASAYLVSWIGMRNMPPNPQTKMMSYMFPIMMTGFFVKVSAGLNLYYAVQNLATLPQQWLLARERAKSIASTGTARVQGRGVTSSS